MGQLELLVKSKICVKNRLYMGGGVTSGFLMNQYLSDFKGSFELKWRLRIFDPTDRESLRVSPESDEIPSLS